MAEDKLEIVIRAKTDEFVKSLDDIKKRSSDLSKQMQEIDKQLKTESVDRVAKLSEKLELVKRSAALAAKEAEDYAKKIKEISENHKEGEELTEKQKKKIEDLSEKMALAKQKANTFAVEIDKLSKELEESSEAANKAEGEIEDVSEATDAAAASAEDGAKGLGVFGQSVAANLLSTAITTGIKKTISLFKSLANAAWNAAKKIASTAWEWAQSGDNLIETENKVSAVFKESSEEVTEWADNAAHNVRTTKKVAMETASSFGNILVNMGATSSAAANYSTRLIEVAAAQADFNNLGTEEVLQKIQSALTGNYQGLKALGIVMNAEQVNAKALAMTHKENADELTELEKTLARIELIFDGSANAEEKFKENSSSLVSLTAELKSRFGDLRDEIGSKLTPVFENLFQKIADYISSEQGQELIDKIVGKVEELTTDLTEFLDSGKFIEFLETIERKLPEIWDDACKLAEALGTVAGWILKIANPLPEHNELKELDEAIKSSKKEVHAFAESVDVDMDTLRLAISGYAELNGLKLSEIYGDWSNYQPMILEYMQATGTAAGDMKDDVTAATTDMANQVKTDADAMADALQEGLNRAGNADITALEGKTAQVESLGTRIGSALGSFIDNYNLALGSFVSGSGLFQNAPGRAAGGPVVPGQIYQVNDDYGHRNEMFIPAVPGYILNGNDTQSVINNNSTNNSRTYGDINVYVGSAPSGTNVDAWATQLGEKLGQKLRISGAW